MREEISPEVLAEAKEAAKQIVDVLDGISDREEWSAAVAQIPPDLVEAVMTEYMAPSRLKKLRDEGKLL